MEIKILDFLFNNSVCSLIYMHDVTSLLKLNRREVTHTKSKAEITKALITQILTEPYKLLIKIKKHIKTHVRPDIPQATEEALTKLAESLVEISLSLNSTFDSFDRLL